MKKSFELGSFAASPESSALEEQSEERQKEVRTKLVGQMKIPVYQKKHFWSPDFVKCDGKIIRYDLRALGIWRALVSCSHTILTDWETWQHMVGLYFVGFLTALFVITTQSSKTLGEASPVTQRISLLISFILSAYITITVNRWDRIRNGTLGALWGALENLNMIVQRVLMYSNHPSATANNTLVSKNLKNGEELKLAEELVRLSRLTLVLTFKACQDVGEADQLIGLLNQELITEEERQWLLATTLGTRPLMVVTWMEGYVGNLEALGYDVPRHLGGLAGMQLNNIRGGIGATLGAIGAQLPYPYVHLVYWTVQLLLGITAIQYGCDIGVDYYTKINGDGQYSPDVGTWPQDPAQWWAGQIMVNIAGFTIFALFCEGIMNICAKIANPCALTDIAFSERVYASFMYNNCKALRAGFYSYKHLNQAPLSGPPGRQQRNAGNSGNPGAGAGAAASAGLGGSGANGGKNGSGAAIQGGKNSSSTSGGGSGVSGVSGVSGGSAGGAGVTEHAVVGTRSTHCEGSVIGIAIALSG